MRDGHSSSFCSSFSQHFHLNLGGRFLIPSILQCMFYSPNGRLVALALEMCDSHVASIICLSCWACAEPGWIQVAAPSSQLWSV